MANPWKVTSLLMTGLLATSLATTAVADRQPKMRDALKYLVTARTKLKAAATDKGGHRVKAIEHVENAIAEVEAGIQFDNQH